MTKIVAKGKYYNEVVEVECTLIKGKPVITIDGTYYESSQREFLEYLKVMRPIGGTYYPPENSMLAAYAVIEHDFFDNKKSVMIEVFGDIGQIPTIEGEDDIVY